MTVIDILKSDLSDSQKLQMINILQEGGVAKQAEGGSVKVLKPTKTILIGNKEYDVEIADTEDERKDGLSRVEELGEDEGMLFIHDDVTSGYYTMEDTSIPLDIIFIDEDKKVISVNSVEAYSEDPVQCENYKYVLEVNISSGIKEGDTFEFDNDDLDEDEKKQVSKSKMLVLDSNGDVQMQLEGGERIFSRIFTRKLIKTALKAYKNDSDMYYRKVAKMVFKELDAQDSRDPEYVESPNKD